MTRFGSLLVVSCLLLGCEVLDPARPVAHPDTELFGNLLEVTSDPGADHRWLVRFQIGIPRAFLKAESEVGRPTPPVEKGLTADILVNPDTVVLRDGRSAAISDIDPGSEVVVIPRPGTTRMLGASRITAEAAYLTDFESYRRWQLPGLLSDEELVATRVDPSAINSDGIEHAPVPVQGGRVLYFAARLRVPEKDGAGWAGARRRGLPEPVSGYAAERSYRTELVDGGWISPEPVFFPGLEAAVTVRISWVSDDETRCLVTVEDGGPSWMGVSGRSSMRADWGPVDRLPVLEEEVAVADAVYLAGSRTKYVFTARPLGGGPGNLWLLDGSTGDRPAPLDPSINSAASEWSPRVGPTNQLFFTRDDHQLVYSDGAVRELRLPGPHRRVVTEAAPTGDGRWVFLCLPRYRPVELDQDIYVAAWASNGELGEPLAVDDWRP